jgi:hypothetical protein
MGVADRECALMRALRAQTCAQHHISSIGGQTAGPVELQIGTNTHLGQWAEVMGVADRECALIRAAPHIQHRRSKSSTDGAPNWHKNTLGQWAHVMGVGSARVPLENEREARK